VSCGAVDVTQSVNDVLFQAVLPYVPESELLSVCVKFNNVMSLLLACALGSVVITLFCCDILLVQQMCRLLCWVLCHCSQNNHVIVGPFSEGGTSTL
jgi:hypothetical protein